MLADPQFDKQYKLKVDACASGMGAVLLPEDDRGLDRPIWCFMCKLLQHQLAYNTIAKEALAL